MNKLLVVEDEEITADLLKRYFEIMGYDVINALTGKKALSLAKEAEPSVIILDIGLPDMTGYDVCRALRGKNDTKTIPIIFLTSQGERRNRLSGLELGADDYITKPFNIEELRIKVHNIIDRLGGAPLVDARTSLPSKSLIKERLPERLDDEDSAFFYVDIAHAAAFEEKYGPVAQNQVVRSAARIIGDVLQTVEPVKSFVGHPEDVRFLVVTSKDAVKKVEELLPKRFAEKVKSFYDYPDQERGKMEFNKKLIDFMALTLNPVEPGILREQFLDVPHKRPQNGNSATEKDTPKEKPAEKVARKTEAQNPKKAVKAETAQKEVKDKPGSDAAIGDKSMTDDKKSNPTGVTIPSGGASGSSGSGSGSSEASPSTDYSADPKKKKDVEPLRNKPSEKS